MAARSGRGSGPGCVRPAIARHSPRPAGQRDQLRCRQRRITRQRVQHCRQAPDDDQPYERKQPPGGHPGGRQPHARVLAGQAPRPGSAAWDAEPEQRRRQDGEDRELQRPGKCVLPRIGRGRRQDRHERECQAQSGQPRPRALQEPGHGSPVIACAARAVDPEPGTAAAPAAGHRGRPAVEAPTGSRSGGAAAPRSGARAGPGNASASPGSSGMLSTARTATCGGGGWLRHIDAGKYLPGYGWTTHRLRVPSGHPCAAPGRAGPSKVMRAVNLYCLTGGRPSACHEPAPGLPWLAFRFLAAGSAGPP